MDFLFFPRSGSAVGTLAPSFGGQGPTLGIAFRSFFFPPQVFYIVPGGQPWGPLEAEGRPVIFTVF